MRWLWVIIGVLGSSVGQAAAPAVCAVAFHPNNTLVAAAVGDEFFLFDATKGTLTEGPLSVGHRITALSFDPQGRWLAVAWGEAGRSGSVYLHPLNATLRPLEFRGHRDLIYALAFAPNGQHLATAGYDRDIQLWKLAAESKKPIRTLKDHSDAVYGLSFHPDGRWLASASADRTVKIWDVETGQRLYSLGDATDWLYAVAWSPDKKHLAAAGVDKSIRIWQAQAEGGQLVNTAFAHEKAVWRLAYSRDGQQLYSLGEDRIIKIWDAAKLAEVKTFPAQADTVLDWAIRPDGQQIAIARFDGAGLLINAAEGKTIHQLLPLKNPPPPAAPKITTLAPAVVTRGKTAQFTVNGTHLSRVRSIFARSGNSRWKADIVSGGITEIVFTLTIPATALSGTAQVVLETESGPTTTAALLIDAFDAISEEKASFPLQLPVTVVGSLSRPGEVDEYRFRLEADQSLGVHLVTSEPTAKFEPILTLSDETGAIVAEGTTALAYLTRAAGTYTLRVFDHDFRGGDLRYRLNLGNLPVVTGVFPLAVAAGRTTTVHVLGVNLGSPVGLSQKVTVPPDASPGTKITVPLDEPAVGTPTVVVSNLTSVVVDPVRGAELRVPGCADGILAQPQGKSTISFSAKKGERLVVEVLARRAGSPVDALIEILDASGQPLPRATLRCVAKTYVTFRDHDSVRPGIRLEAWNELGIDDYLYVNGELMRILALPRGPDDDCQFYQVNGQRVGFLGTTPVQHSMGEPMYKVEIHPPRQHFPPNGMPVFTLYYRNDDGGPGFGKDSYLLFDPPADGTYQVRISDARGASGPTHAYRLIVRRPQPDFTFSARVDAPQLLQGGAVPIEVKIDRTDGFEGPVAVEVKQSPPGFTAPATTIESGHQTATLALFGTSDRLQPTEAKLTLVAHSSIDGRARMREVTIPLPTTVGKGDIVTTVRQSTVTIRPGQETRFTVDIQRQGQFTGRVPLDVRNLPHGVRVLHVGLNGILITERETSREVVLYAEPWVQPMERPIVVLARREGARGEFAAQPVLLKVVR
ncbi:MAG: WD40 repeat domain-containing protein [Gemmataceae bacterium]|nr:WD40 repeat domain-containing protein [Gemmata sp.]MDW8196507.1 WD40 repeat domain-containing protein [Gemmataceae bacterium]